MSLASHEYLILLTLHLLGGWTTRDAFVKYVYGGDWKLFSKDFQSLIDLGWVWDSEQQTPPDWFIYDRNAYALYVGYPHIEFIGLTDKGMERVKEFPIKPLDTEDEYTAFPS
jgi:hypothetical protein